MRTVSNVTLSLIIVFTVTHDGSSERFCHDRMTEITDAHALGIVPAIEGMLSLQSAQLRELHCKRLSDMVLHLRMLDKTVGQRVGYRL